MCWCLELMQYTAYIQYRGINVSRFQSEQYICALYVIFFNRFTILSMLSDKNGQEIFNIRVRMWDAILLSMIF